MLCTLHVVLVIHFPVRRSSSCFENKRWISWSFVAENYQFSAHLLLILWTCVEAAMLHVKPNRTMKLTFDS